MRLNRPRRDSERMSCESGSIIVFTAIVLLGLLTFSALAIDAGNLYRAQLAAQNAADSSALAIVNFINMQGKIAIERRAAGGVEPPAARTERETQVTTFLRGYATELGRANMDKSGFPHLEGTYDVDVNGIYLIGTPDTVPGAPSFSYTVQVQRRVPHLLMDKIPFVSTKFSSVTAAATSVRQIANVALLLDVSGSLGCPKDGVCTCLSDGSCPGAGRKFDALVDGVKEFVSYFDLDNDNISLVAYNLGARTLSMEELRGAAGVEEPISVEDIEVIAEHLRGVWTPTGPTNICDAIMEASGTMERVAPDQTVSYVLFSDGAPTAGRFLFADDVTTVKLDESNLGYGNYDYSMFTVDWLRPSGTFGPGESRTFAGPSMLLESAALLSSNEEDIGAYFEDPASPERPPGRPACADGLASAPKITAPSDVPNAVNMVVSPCLNSMKSHLPGDLSRTYGAQYGASGPGSESDWRRQYYHCAIELADFLRSTRNATFYTLGLGERPVGAAPSDPYENIEDTANRKDVFLSRVTFDLQESNAKAEIGPAGEIKRQRFAYNEYRDYSDLPAGMSRQYGIYLPTQRADDLRLMFQQIARKVLLRLTS